MALTLGVRPGSGGGGSLPSEGATVARVVSHAKGLQLLGRLEGSGYREPPWLVRRADGQMLQLTPVLFAVLAAIDGERTSPEIAAALLSRNGLAIDPVDVDFLIDERLRPLGVIRLPDGSEPAVRRSSPLLGLRGRVVMVGSSRTTALARQLAPLFRAPVVAVVLSLFLATSWWLLSTGSLGTAVRDLFHQPGALLAVIGLTIVSGAFHEVGHAAACRYGGATPGPMGAGLYLVWPAFYTDVSDSYRLDRRARLRVDLGGLYFNAVFSVAAFGAWVITGWNPLLVVMVGQLLQMARQLAPLVRLDGYHVLADLVGVPDLFARIRPVLIGLLPTRWGHPEARVLKPWARAVVSLWVLLVVPILLFSLLIMVLSFPRLAATAAEGLGDQWAGLRQHWARSDLLRMALSAVAMLTIALPVASVCYLLSRFAQRAARKAWSSTASQPRARRALVAASVSLVLALLAAWWPQGQYQAIDEGEHLTLPALGQMVDSRQPAADGAESGDGVRALTGDLGGRGGRGLLGSELVRAPETTDDGVGGHEFSLPAPPRDHDNQAVAVGYGDDASTVEVSHSVDFAEIGDVDHRNEAYALASCSDCRTTAIAFQLVLVVGDHDMVAPRNHAVAQNVRCLRCDTRALAVQLVLPIAQRPDAETLAALSQIWGRLAGLERAVAEQGLGAAQSLLHDIEAEVVALLTPDSSVLDETTTTSDGTTTTTTRATTTTTATSATTNDGPSTSGSSTTEPDGSTSTTATSTTTTSEPTTTTTAPPGG
ncbi:MAG: hypothetical protein ACOYXM_16835 [Actinomycetota bacterium]